MVKFPRLVSLPPAAPAPTPVQAAPVQPRPAPAPRPLQFTAPSQFTPSPTPAGTTLHTERLGDGSANCLEKAVGLARPGDSIVLMSDTRDGVGHALVRRPDGSVIDPNHPQVRYETLGQWQALHPRYSQPVTVPASQVQQVLSTPPGPQREALIRQLGLSGVANRQVADDEPRWVAPTSTDGVNFRNAPSTQGSQILSTESQGTRLQVLGENDDGTWLNVQLEDGTQGWVFAELVGETTPPPPPPAPPPPPRFPDWLAQGTCPPHIPEPLWNGLPQNIQQQVIQTEREKAVSQAWPMPEFDLQGPPPPNVDLLTWSHLPDDGRQALYREHWQTAVREQTDLLFNGVPPGGLVVESPFIGVDSTLGRGQVGPWYENALQHGAAAQYINLEKLLGPGFPQIHYNLCGPLAVGASLGMTPEEALTAFKDSIGDVSENILETGSVTHDTHLEKFYEAQGWQADIVKLTMTPPWEMARLLAEGKQLTTLVNIDTKGADGKLRDYDDSTKQVAHWVNVRAVEQDASGDWMVRVYNPYENREEVYSWDDFETAWNKSGGVTNGEAWTNNPYVMVIATPPTTATE
ncbi:SH3 domain-containing protein [Pyxidicoccus xibeiensis]|uniref:SH3 domain-containing protein n=1 Tax=Pyxidicoccus xibeiensis TaxID=2906759 RepID=UPI0020A73C62|nr:SH3 domain-containing protein [Pyxidicoccus xibeiensis]MCP3143274.1 SH3 domain-containing protein [Pyxidicoccus xibeiensis]